MLLLIIILILILISPNQVEIKIKIKIKIQEEKTESQYAIGRKTEFFVSAVGRRCCAAQEFRAEQQPAPYTHFSSRCLLCLSAQSPAPG
jgi:hypothetical protein